MSTRRETAQRAASDSRDLLNPPTHSADLRPSQHTMMLHNKPSAVTASQRRSSPAFKPCTAAPRHSTPAAGNRRAGVLVQANPLEDVINGLTVGCMSGKWLGPKASTSPWNEPWLAPWLQSPLRVSVTPSSPAPETTAGGPPRRLSVTIFASKNSSSSSSNSQLGLLTMRLPPACLPTGRPEELPPERGQEGARQGTGWRV